MPDIRQKRTRDRLRRCSGAGAVPAVTPSSSSCLPDTDHEKPGLALAFSATPSDFDNLQGVGLNTDTTFV